MYFSVQQIEKSIKVLGAFNPFFGITYLTCKRSKLPVGEIMPFHMDSATAEFMETYFRISPDSQFYFQPFKSNDANKQWVKHNYPSTGLQSINTRTFRDAFLHKPNTQDWGWDVHFVETLKSKLPKNGQYKIRAFDFAVWIYKQREWSESVTAKFIVDTFINEFNISNSESDYLFDTSAADHESPNMFDDTVVSWRTLSTIVSRPPDVGPSTGGILSLLETKSLGPAKELKLIPGRRLTLITGDNGLGKSFLLEAAWWALTGSWAGLPAFPKDTETESTITFELKKEGQKTLKSTVKFDSRTNLWPPLKTSRPTLPGLVAYMRVDSSFAVWDPIKVGATRSGRQHPYSFSSQDVWDGLGTDIEGLIRDWSRWQNSVDQTQFKALCSVLRALSPPDLGELKPGLPTRIPGDSRDIPTIVYPYGSVPIVYSSAGVRRIVTVAYLIVWAWFEHTIAAKQAKTTRQNQLVVLIDEIEAHLHPHWQRSILPAIMEIGNILSPDLNMQIIVATHSPLVMASSEQVFDEETDKLFHLDLTNDGNVSFKELSYAKFGDVSAWLTSPVFELKQARSSNAEKAIESAKRIQLSPSATTAEVVALHSDLLRALPADDPFWPRWIVFAQQNGVKT